MYLCGLHFPVNGNNLKIFLFQPLFFKKDDFFFWLRFLQGLWIIKQVENPEILCKYGRELWLLIQFLPDMKLD